MIYVVVDWLGAASIEFVSTADAQVLGRRRRQKGCDTSGRLKIFRDGRTFVLSEPHGMRASVITDRVVKRHGN